MLCTQSDHNDGDDDNKWFLVQNEVQKVGK